MSSKLLRSKALRTMLVAFVLLASGFALVVSTQYAAAASARTNLIVGLQNDMVNLNYFDPATNSVWKAYQVQYNYEGLFTFDPDYQLYADLADPTATCPSGTTQGVPGSCIDSSLLNYTVFIRQGITFTDGQPLTADDVVFTYQTLAWSTYATSVLNAIWWDTPLAPLWNGNGNSHIAVFKINDYEVRFQLTPHTLPGLTNAGYALVYYDTLGVPIIPKHIWENHLNSAPPINYSDPNLGPITDTQDRSIDFSYGANVAQKDATTGTGPFYLVSWTKNAGSVVKAYPDYWAGPNGQDLSHVWKGTTYKFYPKALTEIDFVVYGSLDVVSLALQKGEIDTLLWSLTPGFVNVVSSNPAVTVATVTDSGYFYLSFNLREEPWNQLPLRQAVSMAIDKNYIVNTLMGGYGTPGTVPISIANPIYVNTSAAPPSFDLAQATATLNSNGYTVDPNTGFYDDPNGTPIKATILTPPKDYDPVRADAGIMISNNLKQIGLDIDSAPTSFDTIVAKAFTPPVKFDIYVLGWSLGLFPEAYLANFFATNQDVNLNPAGSNSAGYHNPTVDYYLNKAVYTADNTQRIGIIKYVEGIVTNDIPWNVLYYRKNVVAWRNDAWSGWVLYPNQNAQFNFWSIVNIVPTGTGGGGGVSPPSGALNVAVSLPDQVFYREAVPINVYVGQGSAPASGATVTVNLTFGTYTTEFSGTADASGHYSTTWTVPLIQGSGVVVTSAAMGTLTGTNTKVMESTIGPPMPSAQLVLSSDTPVIGVGGTATLTATVTDSQGSGISGVEVTIDTTLVAGTVTPSTGTTNANGVATFTYAAPTSDAKFPNAQLIDIVKATVNVPNTIAADTQAAQFVMVVQNNAAPNWDIVSLNTTGLLGTMFTVNSPTPTSFTMDVTDFTGAPLAGVPIDAVYSDTANFTVNAAGSTSPSGVTSSTGQIVFFVNATADALTGGNSTTLALKFVAHNIVYSTSDTILVFLANATSTGYGGYESVGSRAISYSPTASASNVSVHLFDQLGVPASGVPVFYQIYYGDFGLAAQFPMSLTYGDTIEYPSVNGSLDLNSFAQGSLGGGFQNSTGQGAAYGVENFINDYEVVNWNDNAATGTTIDSCDPSTYAGGFAGLYYMNVTSATDAAGVYTAPFNIEQYPKDAGIQVLAYVGGTPDIAVDACGFVGYLENYAATMSTGLVTERAPIMALSQFSTSKAIATSQANSVVLRAQFKDINGVVSKPMAMLGSGIGSALRNVLGTYGGPMTGTSAGWINYTRYICTSASTCTATSALPTLSQAFSFTYVSADSRYAFSGHDQIFYDALGPYWFAPTFEWLLAKVSFSESIAYLYLPTTTAFLTVGVGSGLLSQGATTPVTVTVYSSLTGTTIPGASVWIGTLQATTNDTGVAVVNVTASALSSGATEGLIVATTPYGGVARGWYAFMVALPVLTYSNLAVTTQGLAGEPTTLTVSVQNTLAVTGNQTVWLMVDNATVAGQVVNFGASQTKTVTFTYVFAAGGHQVNVGGKTLNLNIEAPVTPVQDMTTAYALAIGLLIAGLVVGLVVGIVMGRRRKAPPMAMPEETKPMEETPKSAEEELGPEDKL